MVDKDRKRYYARLGVPPTATLDEIKSAYRRLAKNMHPDRNTQASSTRDFQQLNEAYRVLSDPTQRAAYDASHFERVEHSADGEPTSRLEPVRCSSCGMISAQLRYVIFIEVKSFVVATVRTPVHGIFCPTCAGKKAVRSSIITWLFGWWALPWGLIYSPHAIFRNLVGGHRPADVNARLLARQAYALARPGMFQLARAVALDALDTAKTFDTPDELAEVVQATRELLHTLDDGAPLRKLKNRWRPLGGPFIPQLAFPAILGLIATYGVLSSDVAFRAPKAGPSFNRPALPTPLARAARPADSLSVARYVRPSTAPNGKPWPHTAQYLEGFAKRRTGGYSTLTVDNSRNDSDVLAKLFFLGGNSPVVARVFYIPAGKQFTVSDIAPGLYDLKYRELESGRLARTESFSFQQTFEGDGVRYTALEVTLYKVIGGTLKTYQISEEEFD